jgi:hypothetical protein
MAVRVKADTTDLHKLATDAGVADDAMIHEVAEAVRFATVSGWGVARSKAPVFTGLLAGSIQATVPSIKALGETVEVTADFHTGAYEHAVVMEYGRGPTVGSSGSPGGLYMAIWRWVDLKAKRGQFNLNQRPGESRDSAVDRAAFLVKRKIDLYGTEPREYMKAGEVVAQQYLERLIHRGVDITVTRFVVG